MGILQNLLSKIFRRPHSAAPASSGGPRLGTVLPAPAAAAAETETMERVDVEAMLDEMAGEASQKLDWRHSIVDLMKLVGMDSSLAERKQLAAELHYTGSTQDTAAMNLWLHKQVLRQIADNGGKVPESLLD